jgi:penicillin-binding protein 1B
MKIGMNHIVKTAASFHFSTPIKAYPSLALGAFEVIPLELARAYSVFAADGLLPYPLSMHEVTDENGKILQQRHMNVESVISPAKAFIMNSLLRSVITEGTAQSLLEKGISWPVAGKTGTTNNCRDAWFVGYTPEILALVWVGFDNGDSIFSTGAKAAMPIWADLMKDSPQFISENWFRMPPGCIKKTVCSESGLLAVENGCPHPVEEIFLKENRPTLKCPLHRKQGSFDRITRELKEVFKTY